MPEKTANEKQTQGANAVKKAAADPRRVDEPVYKGAHQFREIFDNSADGILIFTTGGVIVQANPAALDLYGYTKDEMIGLSGKDIVHPDYYHLFEDFKKQLKRTGRFYAESVDLRKDGTPFTIEVRGSSFLYENEPHLLAIVRDITERKQAEEALARRAKQFLALHETAVEITKMHDLQSLLNKIVEKATCLLGGTGGGMYLCDPEKKQVRCVVSHQTPRDFTGTVLKYGEGAAGTVAQTGKPLIVDDYTEWLNRAEAFEKDHPFRSVVSTPMLGQEEIIGVLHVLDDERANRFTKEDLHLLNLFAGQAAIAIYNARLMDQIQTQAEALRNKNDELRSEISERRKTEASLRKTEASLAAAQRIAHVGSWEWNILNDNAFWSDETCRIFDLKPDIMMDHRRWFLERVHPDDRARVDQALTDAIAGTREYDLEYRIVQPDKTEKTIHARAEVIHDDAGEAVMMRGTVHDISSLKRKEQALLESEQRYKTLFERNLNPIAIIDTEGHYLDANAAFLEFVEESRERLLQMHVFDFSHPDERFEAEESHRKVWETGGTLETEYVIDGEIKVLEITMTPISYMGVNAVVGVGKDITDRKRAEEALRKSEEQYRILFENAGEAIFIAQEGRLQFANKKSEEICGYPRGELLAKPFVEFIHEEDRALVLDRHIKRQQGADIASSYPFRLVHKSGEIKWVELNAVLIEWEGEVATLNYLRDITDRKRMEEERETLQKQFAQSQKMESIGRLAGGVAHDFNNMLGVILGHAELAMERIGATSPIYNDLVEIRKAAQRSADLTRQLLAFARKEIVAPKILDLNDVVTGMLKMLRRLIGEDIDLTWKPGAALWPVKIDPAQLDQILVNLCVNARDAISGVGRITIETENRIFDAADCKDHPECVPGDYVMLSIRDDGHGMDKKTLENLFEPFFTTKEVGQGTGLGLATVFGIVKQNNGMINVSSEPGQGAMFEIYLPRIHSVDETKDGAATEPVPTGTETVLLVEDEEAILRLGKAVLERFGYTVIAARTPAEALAMTEQHEGSIQILVSDVVMPEMDGKELKKHIEKHEPGIKVLFMSGYTADVIVNKGILEKDVNFLQKPFTVRSLGEKVREVLDQASSPGREVSSKIR